MRDLKYLFAYSIPFSAFLSVYFLDYFSFGAVFYAFVIIPVLETIIKTPGKIYSEEEKSSRLSNILFDLMLYGNLPIVFGILGYGFYVISTGSLSTIETVGVVLSLGILLATNAINVAHELGHRKTRMEQMMSKALLLPCLYMHFYLEHNFGHHLHAATPQDPATARYNQSVYSFWFSSIKGQYIKAWSIQKSLLGRAKLPFLSSKNDMFWYTLLQFGYLVGVYLFLGELAAGLAFCIALSGVLLLETINYIEHYGLKRNKTASGRYERISEIHSWNSNHVLGRILLYELTRHSDHHYRAHKKFQLLEYHDSSPQMPFGYTTSMVLALAPPLWFLVMNTLIPVAMRP